MPGHVPERHRYFLRTFVQRTFVFFSAAGVVAVRPLLRSRCQTLTASRRTSPADALIELAKASLTHVALVNHYPGYVVQAERYHLFIGALHDLADLGMAVYSDHGSTIPSSVFTDYYAEQQPTLMRSERGCSSRARATRRRP